MIVIFCKFSDPICWIVGRKLNAVLGSGASIAADETLTFASSEIQEKGVESALASYTTDTATLSIISVCSSFIPITVTS